MEITVTPTPLPGLVLIDTTFYQDDRGFFMESWNERDFAAAGLSMHFAQDSHSRSARGVLRGLHYQDRTAPLGKLVRCTLGRIFDVAVDLRIDSPTFGAWFGVELTADNKRQLYVPEGFAHAYQAISDVVEVQYKQTGFYTPSAENTIAWNDPEIGVAWPLPEPVLSERDKRGMTLNAYKSNPAFTFAEYR